MASTSTFVDAMIDRLSYSTAFRTNCPRRPPMATPPPSRASIDERAEARIIEVSRTLGTRLTQMAGALHVELVDLIPELRGDPMILELLRASVEANI
jgi:hypothetical protein